MGINYRHFLVTIFLISLSLNNSGCQANDNEVENMYDYASRIKTIASGVDGLVKYGNGKSLLNNELLLKAVNGQSEKLQFPHDYSLLIKVVGNNSEVMLCRNEKALIEDTGCTAKSDLHHWKTQESPPCEFTLNLDDLCN